MKKFLAVLLIIFTLFTFSAKPVSASFIEDFWQEILNDAATNLGKFSVETIFRTAGTLLYAIAGYGAPAGSPVAYSNNPDSYYGAGLIPSAVTYTAALMNRPIKTSEYVADVLHNTNLVPQAYAQGIGFSGLSPILQLWKAFRNIVYFCFIIVFVIIGFMIMFRKKVGSNSIVTIQEALPKIIITLILVTFSYAIAGIVIDLMYFSIYLITALFQQAGLIDSSSKVAELLFNRNILNIGLRFLIGWTEPAGAAAEGLGSLVGQALGGILGVTANAIFYLIFAIAILIAVFKTFIQLITAYIGIILSTIFAPFQLLPNAFPGNDSFAKWLRGLIANAAVFPTAAAMILLGLILSTTATQKGAADAATEFGITPLSGAASFERDGFLPPLIYSSEMQTENQGESGGVSNVRSLIGFGIIMLLPEVVKIVKKTLEVKEEEYGAAAWKNVGSGNFIAGGAGIVGKAIVNKYTMGDDSILTWPSKGKAIINEWKDNRAANSKQAQVVQERLNDATRERPEAASPAGNPSNTTGAPGGAVNSRRF